MTDKNVTQNLDRPHTQPPGRAAEVEAANNMYAEVDLCKPSERIHIDVEKQFGSENDYVKSAPGTLRSELGLSPEASPEQVYHKMARDMLTTFPNASHDWQQEALRALGLQRTQMNETNVYNAFIARDRRETGTPVSANLSELERNVHRRNYQNMKLGLCPDYD